MTTKSSLALAVTLSLALAACGGNKAPSGQVLATVNGEEITATDLKAELNGARANNQDQQKAMERAALQNIVQRTLLAQAAEKQGLNKGPEYAVLERKAKQLALVETLNASWRKTAPTVSEDEARSFVASNPAMFANRRIFLVDQLVVPALDQATLSELQPVRTLDQARAVLAARKVPSNATVGVLDALSLPPAAAKQIAALPPQEVFIIPSGGGVRINTIRSSQVSVLPPAQQLAIARDLLARERLQGMAQNQAGGIIKAGMANVKYNPAFAPPAEKTGAAPAAAGSTATPAKPVAAGAPQ